MSKGEIALVLHAHLPYVKSAKAGSLEEDWFFQALMECYLPLLNILEGTSSNSKYLAKITIGLSPTLLSLLEDQELKDRFPKWVNLRLKLLTNAPKHQESAARHLWERIQSQLQHWNSCKGDLVERFRALQVSGVVDLLTCAATHGYLPLLRENPEAVRGQLNTAVREHHRLLGLQPRGIWLPECAYYEGLDKLLQEAGLKYAVLDGHGLLNAHPRPRYGIYAPICSRNAIAFFGRDGESTLPIWSAKDGYPGDPEYREFHRDMGWDLPIEKLHEIGLNEPRPLGIKLHKVTSQKTSLNEKETYEPDLAAKKIKEHAKDYLNKRRIQLKILNTTMTNKPLLVAPFDAELFGHWWFEGPYFLAELFQEAEKQDIKFTRLLDVLMEEPQLQLCDPSPSSWGQGGYHNYWLNETNAWIVHEWSKASKAMIKFCSQTSIQKIQERVLKQAGRELLLSQSSDWSFILRSKTTTELAKERINLHLKRFWTLISLLEKEEEVPIELLSKLEKEDHLFPLIDIKDWSKKLEG